LANAQSQYPAPTGIVIPIPVPKAHSRPIPTPSPQAFRKAVPRTLPEIEYTSLPSSDRITDTATTGSLPEASTLGARTPTGFTSLVGQGTIMLRASAPTSCLPGNLLAVVADVAGRFGPISVESTHRSVGHNRRAGGAPHSLHIACRAIDFRIRARSRGVMAYLSSRSDVGGLKMYRNGIIHIDNGTRRSW
jgi:hypothetical protein